MSVARPRISVIIPTYNRAALVIGAVASVLSQDYLDFEVILVDDGSTDGTREAVARRFGSDPRLKVLSQPNGGVARARNLGIDHATGDLISFLDSDDLYLPGHLSAQAARLTANPDAAMSLCDARYEGPWGAGETTFFARFQGSPPQSLADMCRGGWILTNCTMFRAPVVRALRFDPAWEVEDTEFHFRFFAAGHVRVLEPRILSVYRRHGGGTAEPQKTAGRGYQSQAKLEALRLAKIYAGRLSDPAAMERRIERKWSKLLVSLGRHREARPHLWAWWRRRPFQWRAPWLLLSGAFRGDGGGGTGDGAGSDSP